MDVAGLLTVVTAVIVALGALIGATVKWVIVPNLRDMIEQIAETHKQVTQNHHSNEKPTMLDRFDDLEKKIDRSDAKIDKLDEKVDSHLISASAIDATIAARVKAIERRVDKADL